MKKDTIYITRPSLPELSEVFPLFEKIWESRHLTNNGPFHQQFENELSEFLDVPYLSLFSNATLALIMALRALELKGEVITTPYSFIATAHSIWWNGLKPVFIDINPEDANLNSSLIEDAITPATSAILPVHVYGHPCNHKKISEIAERYNLKVIYDAAHAFNVKSNGHSILNWGDLSVLSFHATKTFTTFEGGAIISHSAEMKTKIDNLKNFGITDEINIVGPGINAKMNEMQSAIGLLQLKEVENNFNKRKKLFDFYISEFSEIPGISVFKIHPDIDYNYSYFPVLIDESKFKKSRDRVYDELKSHNIYTRRYFYPLITSHKMYKKHPSADRKNLPVANNIADSVLCIPFYADLLLEDAIKVVEIIKIIHRS